MRVINIHKRTLDQPKTKIAELLNTLASDQDRIWPKEKWPAMKLDQGLRVGSKGGHGPVRYTVQQYDPGVLIQFEFTAPRGFAGMHRFEINKLGIEQTEIQHTIQMNTSGTGTLSWLLVFRWLHDALVEDAFDKLENQFSAGRKITPWNIWVRTLRKTLSSVVIMAFALPLFAQSGGIPIPTIDGDWWSIAGNPDLGEYNSDRQEPVDFGIWQAQDGTWQLWSCIRKSNFPGSSYTTRFLYGWEGSSLTATDWEPQGIKWVADTTLGETAGGMQAPYVIKEDLYYYLFYGDWKRICLARSTDGKHFTRLLGGNGQPDLFTEHPYAHYTTSNARDPMVIKRGNTYYCYYTSHLADPVNDGWAFCRTSLNLQDWSESVKVSHTPPYGSNSPRYSDECPHVVYLPEYELYYLFVTQLYGNNSQTTVYASPNPMYFGLDEDSRKVCTLPIAAPEILYHEGQYYLAALNDDLDGIRMAKLKWMK